MPDFDTDCNPPDLKACPYRVKVVVRIRKNTGNNIFSRYLGEKPVPFFCRATPVFVLFAAFLLVPCFNSLHADQKVPAPNPVYYRGEPLIPLEHGEVVFHCNEKSPNRIYIIGMSHRDTFTFANGGNTVKSQVEAYRIGEWLIRNEGLEILLPEGFFSRAEGDKKEDLLKTVTLVESDRKGPFDNKTLEEKLGDDSIYLNAEMLLTESYNIKSLQVEDAGFYNAVRTEMALLEKSRDNVYEYLFIRSGVNYLQERRTAAMLQKIPDVVDCEYREGRIKNKRAIFTIGLSHIPGIIKYLKDKRIAISSPAFTSFNDYLSEVNLLEKDFGVTIIIPRTLADNRDIPKLTSLDNIR
ncbi:MAG: hypothetical protein C4560_04720 [Nitrospiraceae bacterium]|nr:MAG: hypothetical protein C4560_04720 [Nitrospiraceae bacterium]